MTERELNDWYWSLTEKKRLDLTIPNNCLDDKGRFIGWDNLSYGQKDDVYLTFVSVESGSRSMFADAIRPSYYNRFGMEAVDIAESMYGTRAMIPVALATAFFYVTRIGDKKGNPPQQELDKANWWLAKAEEYKRQINSGNEFEGMFDLEQFLGRK